MRALKKKPIQVYIEPAQEQSIESLARRKGISKAEIIRMSLDKYLSELPVEDDPALGIVGLGSSGKTDISANHDAYLAGHAADRVKEPPVPYGRRKKK
ncbi:MAG: CopG family transcriptional regulator [Nitrospirae bacterium]|nr:CopG family transcriptional regulator [Nitrospirota bacterium]